MNIPYVDPSKLLDQVQQQDLIHGVVRGIIDSSPPEWVEITFEAKSLARLTTMSNWVTRNDGSVDREDFPHSINSDVVTLRRGMYREGVGTWFSMRIHVLPPARFKVDFNYDDRPSYLFDPDPSEYAEDFKKFPRSLENTPDWLREELQQAEQEE